MQVGLDVVVGKRLLRVDEVYDYVQLMFEDKINVNVYNRSHVRPGVKWSEDIIKRKVLSVDEGDEEILISLEGGYEIVIGMRDKDYIGPEALALYLSDGREIIWD